MQFHSIKTLKKSLSNITNSVAQSNLSNQSGSEFNSFGGDSLTKLPIGVATENLIQTSTNINWYYQNRILKRHGQYLTNQWWNGQLSEHNAETIFLSDIDWRSSFIKNTELNGESNAITKIKNLYVLQKNNNGEPWQSHISQVSHSTEKQKQNSSNRVSKGLDISLDFPDTDQLYNPQRRRWFIQKGFTGFWFNLDKGYTEQILSTWILESILQTYTYLHNNTELLDFLAFRFTMLGYTKNPISETKNAYQDLPLLQSKKAYDPKASQINLADSNHRSNQPAKAVWDSNSTQTVSGITCSQTGLSSIKEIIVTTSVRRF
jgi:hypothetical protein